MNLTAVLFDLDGTLLPMDLETFTKAYLAKLTAMLADHGYEPSTLAQTILQSTYAVIKNDGSKTNESLFWEQATKVYGKRILADMPIFDKFYAEEFDALSAVCGYEAKAAQTVRALKKQGKRVILATNPIFPAAATEWRIKWTGLSPDDFELITTYENSRFCKPNLEYYKDILRQCAIEPEECLMVGNDVSDDMSAQRLGMKVFLLTDCLINSVSADISKYPHGSFDALNEYIASL